MHAGWFTVTDHVALVTGAGRGVGAGIAQYLARAGASVIVNDLHADRAQQVADEINESGGRAVAAPFDVTDPQQVTSALAAAQAEVGTIDILVNNAGVLEGGGRPNQFVQMPEEDWRMQIELNLVAFMRLVQLLVPQMIEGGWGRVVQISSGSATKGDKIGMAAYAAGKSGSEGLVRHLAVENGSHGITVNSLALGFQEGLARADDPVVKAAMSAIPTGRAGRPADTGAAVVWLCCDDGGQVNGQVIHINGGSHFGR